MRVGRSLLVALVLATAVALPARARAAAFTPCGQSPGLECTQVDVPLDRTGAVPGTVSLHVERLSAGGLERGVFFLIAGGPGQGSAQAFGLGRPDNASFFRVLFPGYTLVAVDNRGTGRSGVLRCAGLQTTAFASSEQEAALAAQCGAHLGTAHAFYATRDHAEDLEAVRQALGVERIALYGVSYGTKLALAYALAHPDHVDRLLLDSVLPPNLPDPFRANVLRAMPATLRHYCPGATCRVATPNFAAEFVVLANQLAARPISAPVLQAGGARKSRHMSGEDLLGLVTDADLNQGLAAELPAAVHAARGGDLRPLLRLWDLDAKSALASPESLSFGLYAATTCADGVFPWTPEATVDERPALLQSAVDALPPGSLGPFGKWAAATGTATFCKAWPTPAGGAPLAAGPLPNVPVLALAGGLDLRTPVANAAEIVAQFPQGKLLVAPGTGHSVLTADFSFCAQRAVVSWLTTGAVPASCPRAKPLLPPLAAFPRSLDALHESSVTARTLAAAVRTVHEAEAAWLTAIAFGSADPVAGLEGGTLVQRSGNRFSLVRYSVVRGVALSGTVTLGAFHLPLSFNGTITVAGPAAGTLTLANGRVGGMLGGHKVTAGA